MLDVRLAAGPPLAGVAVAGLAIAYAEGTGKNSSDVLFSGQDALGPLITHAATYTVGRSCCSWSARAWPTACR